MYYVNTGINVSEEYQTDLPIICLTRFT
jgi:hypothetical protein